MTALFSSKGISIYQKKFSQIIIRSKSEGKFADTINKVSSLLPPSDYLRVAISDDYILAKQSYDQWSLISLKEKQDKEILKIISNININDDVLASNYTYGQVYFLISGNNKDHYLNKLTHFDLREKSFPKSTMAQTSIARIECSIYNIKDDYLITCGSSFEGYFKDRIQDAINL